MHFPSENHRRELHSVPEFVRVTLAKGRDQREPTVLVKSSTITLKYLSRLATTRFVAAHTPEGWLLYGLRIYDHSEHPAFIWSVAGSADELRALKAMAAGEATYFFLFNEVPVNVAWAPWKSEGDTAILSRLAAGAKLPDRDPPPAVMADFIERLFGNDAEALPRYLSPEFGILPWSEIHTTYITNSMEPSPLSLFAEDEGGQQEELCHWLTDTIQPEGTWRSPQLVTPSKTRELTDFLLSHDYGAFLIESKALSLLQRDPLPDRSRLASRVIKHMAKATRQLTAAIRHLKNGELITDLKGNALEINREQPPHAIILVPDLNLLHDEEQFGPAYLVDFLDATRAFLHILDPMELFRVVQAAAMIKERGRTITLIEALDSYLVQRFETALTIATPDFDVILRIGDERDASSPAG